VLLMQAGSPITVRLRLFGAYRGVGDGRETVLEAPAGISVAELRGLLSAHLERAAPGFDRAVVPETMFAGETRVLPLTERLGSSCVLSVLPPVCGG
jgi:molybdopterin converting factor small subunit